MKIAVLIKQVPASNQVTVDPDTHRLIREDSEMAVNPSDLNALTAAVEIAGQSGGTVTAFSMGPEGAAKALYTALAIGANEAYLVTDRIYGGSDTLGTAKVLAAALEHTGGYDLIFSGDASSDGATGQVGPMVAEFLGMPCIADARGVAMEGRRVTALRPWKDKKIRVRAPLPCFVCVGLGSNKPILPTIRSQMKVNRQTIPQLTNRELKIAPETVGMPGAKSLVIDTFSRDDKLCRQAKMITGSPMEIARQMKALIDGELER